MYIVHFLKNLSARLTDLTSMYISIPRSYTWRQFQDTALRRNQGGKNWGFGPSKN